MAKYAGYDPQSAEPRPVVGWYDSDLHDDTMLPDPASRIELTDAEWDARGPQGWIAGGRLIDHTPPSVPAFPQSIPKLAVIERLAAAGKLREVRNALKLGVADDLVSDAELALRERWSAALMFVADDQEIRAVLAAVGADPDTILAPAKGMTS